MITLMYLDFHCKDGIPANLKLCQKGTWNERMIVETAFSMQTVVCHAKKIFHRVAFGLFDGDVQCVVGSFS